ncbi:hypothetical protein KGQ64_03835 [bacterium]|nr:hypothetical protein [bacterium]
MARNLTRKQFLASAGLLGGMAALPVAEVAAGPVVEVGTLYEVASSRGSRAGKYGPRTGRLSVDRQSFDDGDAYSDLGWWYFFYSANGELAAVRSLATRAAGSEVAYAVPGLDSPTGPVFLSSIGTIGFARGERPEQRTCRIAAPNFAEGRLDEPGGTGSSPYFLCLQLLVRRPASALDRGHRDRMNRVIAEYAERSGLPASEVVPIPG